MASTTAAWSSKLRHLKGIAARPQVWAWVGLAVFASWLRLRHLGYTEIWHDQARTLNMAMEWLHGGPLPLTSDLASLGIRNAPLAIYLYALALAVAPSMFGVLWLIALLNLGGIFVVGAATSQAFGWRAGWWAALLFAVAPAAVYYGRLIWMVSFVPAFAAGLYACLLLYFAVDQKPGYLIAATLFLAATIQTHLTAAALLPPLLIAGAILWRRLRWKPLLLGAALALATFTPFLLFHIRSGFADFAAVQRGLEGRLDVNLTALELALDLFRSRSFAAIMEHAGAQWRPLTPALPAVDRLAIVWLWLGFGAAALGSVRLRRGHDPRAAAGLILALCISLPILPFIPHTRLLHHYYFLHLLPLGPVLMAAFSERLAGLAGRWPRIKPLAAALAFLPLALIAAGQTHLSLAGQDQAAAGAFGKQRVVDTQAAIDAARRLMTARPGCDLVVINEVPLWADSRFGLLREFVDSRRSRFAEEGIYIYPEPCAVYLMTTGNAAQKSWLSATTVPLPDATIRTPTETWTFHDLPAGRRRAAVEAALAGPPLAVWANGLALRSFSLEGDLARGELELTYVWEVGAGLPPGLATAPHSLRFANHLLNADGRLVAQIDGVTSDSRDWRQGDVVKRVWRLPVPADLPPGAYRLATAMYSIPDVARVPLADHSADLLYLADLRK